MRSVRAHPYIYVYIYIYGGSVHKKAVKKIQPRDGLELQIGVSGQTIYLIIFFRE